MKRKIKVAKTLRVFENRREKTMSFMWAGLYSSFHCAYNSWQRAIRRDGFSMTIERNGNLITIYKK